jgi:hypothetical protein
MAFVRALRTDDPTLSTPALLDQIRHRFGLAVHRRTLERAFRRVEKKTTLSTATVGPALIAPPVLVTSYETLRRVALGLSAPTDGPSLGFTLLLRQGMTAWLGAWALYPPPTAPEPAAVPVATIPSVVHHELAQVWAHIVLLHQEVA